MRGYIFYKFLIFLRPNRNENKELKFSSECKREIKLQTTALLRRMHRAELLNLKPSFREL
ncbi:hypothetical protein T4A_4861 [Trichinella pseudospiralis]|uniref:Uncharacterized protein n=1 Tax=Trichinella pseudospiralis TaxID=6337 RepID=A0A0V1EVE9_TRIPS|nr:hypothetical protein T4A_4861 [Trichinella pseudospiralis]